VDGGITWLHGELQQAMSRLTGDNSFDIFLDKDGIAFGEHWQSRLEDALIGARYLLPVISLSYLASPHCRAEA
jgi:F-box protein 11